MQTISRLRAFILLFLPAAFSVSLASELTDTNYVRGEARELNDNGAWSWFMDERAIVDRDRLMVGSVRANGRFADKHLSGWGNVELSVWDLESGEVQKIVLQEHFEQDDHDAPALFVRPDGRYLAAYSKHGQETRMYYRISSEPGDPLGWDPVQSVLTPGKQIRQPGWGNNDMVTYCNPVRLSSENGRIYLFNRSHGLDPNYLLSDDAGDSWRYGGKLYVGRDGYSPYTKYDSNGRDTIHFVATEDHPREFDNSLYHAFVREGMIHHSNGSLIAPLSTSTNCSVHAWDFTRIYQGNSNRVAWMTDIQLNKNEQPVVLFTVQMDSAGLPRGQGGEDHRFHYARWDGEKWHVHEIAYAGRRLYSGEDDYTGLGAIDPQNPSVVYLSSDAELNSGESLISAADGRRHHELFRGESADGGARWTWQHVTANSTMDNLRPLVPVWKDGRTALVWMRGAYRANRGEWTTKVVASILQASDFE